MHYRPILVVEDSDDDFYAMRRALGKTLPCPLMRCSTGNEALDYVFQRGSHAQAERPSLILLDLNLPGQNGRSVLHQLKDEVSLRDIPVVIVSTSNNPEDVKHCYGAGAAGYVIKPLTYDRLVLALQGILNYWFTTVALPNTEH